MAKITGILAEQNISIEALIQKGVWKSDGQAEIVILTHTAVEKFVKTALKQIESLPEVKSPVTMIRMESLHISN